MKLKALLVSMGLGAGLMYFFDPQYGERRRAMVRDKANNFVNNLDTSIDTAVQDVRNRARGVLSEMTARLSNERTPDWVLEERVRFNLGRAAGNTRALSVTSNGGRVTLNGSILHEDEDAIVKAAMRTRGVQGVENQLEVFDHPEDISTSPDVSSTQRQTRVDLGQGSWSPTTRLLSGVGGSLLTLYGLTRTGIVKPVLSTAGLVLATRGVTNLDTRSLLGLGMGENGIRVNKSIIIFAPIDEVYRFWRNFENFPLFMNHVKEVLVQSGVSTWKVAGPAGISFEFQSQITQDIPNDSIAWETLPDSQIHHAGLVRFDQTRDSSTRVTVQMSYVPPAGAVGHAVAQLFGVDPRQAMNEDLMRLKSLLEGRRQSTEEETTEYTETSSDD